MLFSSQEIYSAMLLCHEKLISFATRDECFAEDRQEMFVYSKKRKETWRHIEKHRVFLVHHMSHVFLRSSEYQEHV